MVKLRRMNKIISSLSMGNTILQDQETIAAHFVQHFQSSFTQNLNVIDTGLVERVIPSMVTAADNAFLTIIPSSHDVLEAVKAMDGFSAPGPDGFGGCFFSSCWDVVGKDVTLAVQSFFTNGYILPHFNSSLLILIPKSHDTEGITDFQPIALANFVFKIITKILTHRLGHVASRIISPNQSAFIKGRSIVDPISLTSECVNLLDHKCKRGNIAIKFDIRKAFDTLDWGFLLRVLTAFGFAQAFVTYIHA